MITLERTGGTATIDLGDGPSQFDGVLLPELAGALDDVEADGDVTMLVTTARGKHYSNGYDLPYLGSLAEEAARDYVLRSNELLVRLLTFPVPTVAAINGHAFGLGAMLALAHDRRAMRADRGWFCFPEVDLGLRFRPFQQALVTSRLPAATAREAILSGRRYTAPEAVTAGIVHAVAPEDGLLDAAVALGEPWTGRDRTIVEALKRDIEADVIAALDVDRR